MTDAAKIWTSICSILTDTKEISSVSYQTWIASIKPLIFRNNCLYLIVPSEMHRRHITTVSNYKIYITTALNMTLGGRDSDVVFLLENEAPAIMDSSDMPQTTTNRPMLNEKYTFDNFVTGSSNQFAYAAALSVAEAPATVNNPLFIYGGVGLGKTHLMHAIGNFILQTNKDAKVLYITCEKYTNEFIDAISKRKTSEFRERYRKNVDILMIDDIQFLAGKDSTQEEIFHNINDLFNVNRQIIMTSDRHPKSIATLEDRLRSRFEGGLLVDITPPDLETRVAILRRKAEAESVALPDDILFYIADKASDNVRELEGALKRVIAYSTIMGKTISLEMASEALKDYQAESQKHCTPVMIIEIVSKYFSVEPEDITGKKRDQQYVLPRHIAMYLCRECTDLSFPRIGDEFGGRDHSTVINGIGKIRDSMKLDSSIRTYVNDIEMRLQGI